MDTMNTQDYINIALFVVGILLAIIGVLIKMKLARNDKDIQILYGMHHADEKELNELKLKVAESYPSKADMKEMFTEFKAYLDERFNNVEQIARYSGSRQQKDTERN
jgi:hypothetical protein